MDVYEESFAKRPSDPKDKMNFAIKIALLILCVLALIFVTYLAVIPLGLMIWWILRSRQELDSLYECSYDGEEFLFSMLCENRRKKLFSCKAVTIEEICPENLYRAPGVPIKTVYDFRSHEEGAESVYMTVRGEKEKILVIFEPGENMMKAILKTRRSLVKTRQY